MTASPSTSVKAWSGDSDLPSAQLPEEVSLEGSNPYRIPLSYIFIEKEFVRVPNRQASCDSRPIPGVRDFRGLK